MAGLLSRSVRWWIIFPVLALAPSEAQTSTFKPSFQQKALPTPCATGAPSNVLTGDFNGDHKADLAIVCADPRVTAPTADIAVLLGNGDGTFQTPRVTSLAKLTFHPTASGMTPISGGNVLAFDVNGDGRTDILLNGFGATVTQTTHFGFVTTTSCNLIVLLAAADGTLGSPATVAPGLVYFAEAFADLNGDGIQDLLLDGAATFDGWAVMLGKPGGAFGAPTPLPMPTGRFRSRVGAVADFNADGKPDVVISDFETISFWILLNQGGGSFAPPAEMPAPPSSSGYRQILSGDFNGDGKLDIAVALTSGTSELAYALTGNGDGTFQPQTAHIGAFNSTLVGLDINGDGKLDLAQQDGALISFDLSKGDGTFDVLPPVSFGGPFKPTVVADFNGDGKPDMADTASVLINTATIAATTAALNGASFRAGDPLTAGSLVSLFGTGFTTSNTGAAAVPLTNTLGGVSVTIAGFPAPLLFVSPSQINLQVPWEVSGSAADIVVTAQSGTALAPFHASIGPVSPGIFALQSGTGQAIATIFPDGAIAGPTGSIPGLAVHPVKAGDALVIFTTGLGAVSPSIPDGDAPGAVLRNTTVKPEVLIGGEPAGFLFSGLSPQFVGVYQVNVIVPQVAAGIVPLRIKMGGIVTSDQITIAVENP